MPASEPDPLKNVQQMSKAIGMLARNKEGFARVAEAFEADDVRTIRDELNRLKLGIYCRWICMFFCTWRCERACFRICDRVPVPIPPLDRLREFARASAKLSSRSLAARLEKTIDGQDKAGFESIVRDLVPDLGKEYGFIFCRLVCRWFCTPVCFRRCRRICIFK